MRGELEDELRCFLQALFEPNDIVEVRPIEVWTDATSGQSQSKVIRNQRLWLTPEKLFEERSELEILNINERANIFMGVNPRARIGGGRKSDIRLCRSVWADMDFVTPEVARWRCHEVGLPDPSLLVDSGRGVHLYWLLDRSFEVSSLAERQQFEFGLKQLYRRLGTDATNDVNRVLRLPGFWNMKNVRNGEEPLQCRLVQCCPDRRFESERLMRLDPDALNVRTYQRRSSIDATDRRVARILARLDYEVEDRSRRDFGVVCSLLRIGIRSEEIWSLVRHFSKFATNGRGYYDRTIANAMSTVQSSLTK